MVAIPVHNLHRRRIAADLDTVGAVIDTLGSGEDLLWPVHDWLPLRLDGPLELGTPAGHGPARYHVTAYQPGRWIRFEFYRPGFLVGFHEFSVHPAGKDATDLQHLLAVRLTPAGWPVYPMLLRTVHDTVIEMALDRAERATVGWLADPVRPGRVFAVQKALLKLHLKLTKTS